MASYSFGVEDDMKNAKIGAAIFGLFLAAFFSHFPILKHAVGFLNSDFGAFILNSEELLGGKLNFFMLQQQYGGTLVINLLRAALLSFVGAGQYLWWISFYAHVFLPFLLAVVVFVSGSRWFSAASAYCVALSVACGWTHLFKELNYNDYYVSYVLCGVLLLGMRAKIVHPLRELAKGQLIWVGFLTGYGIYSCKAILVLVVSFWFPWDLLSVYWKSIASLKEKWARVLLVLGFVLIGFGLYLFLFGENLGAVAGKNIVIAADPNFNYALYIFVILWIFANRAKLNITIVKRSMLVMAGVILGYLPELISGNFQFGTGYTHGFEGMLRGTVHLPIALKILMAPSVESVTALLYVVFALVSVTTLVCFSRKEKGGSAIVASLALGLFAFLRVRFYEGYEGPVRYLFPLLPGLWFAAMSFLDKWSGSDWSRFVSIGFFLLLGVGHIQGQWAYASQESIIREAEAVTEIPKIFKKNALQIVVTSSYLLTNQFTAAARNQPVFIGPNTWIEASDGASRLVREQRVGYLMEGEVVNAPTHISVRGVFLKLRQIGKVGKYLLFEGTKG